MGIERAMAAADGAYFDADNKEVHWMVTAEGRYKRISVAWAKKRKKMGILEAPEYNYKMLVDATYRTAPLFDKLLPDDDRSKIKVGQRVKGKECDGEDGIRYIQCIVKTQEDPPEVLCYLPMRSCKDKDDEECQLYMERVQPSNTKKTGTFWTVMWWLMVVLAVLLVVACGVYFSG